MENEETKLIEQEARIVRYLKGQMTPEEEKLFVTDLESDRTLKSMAVTVARMVKSMKEVGSQRDKNIINEMRNMGNSQNIEELISSFTEQHNADNTKRILFIPRKMFATISVAASILLCVWGGYHMYDNHRMDSLGSEYLAYFPVSEFSRGEADEVTSEITSLYNAVETGQNMLLTIEHLEKIWQLSLAGEYNEYTEWSPQIGWILANAYVRENDKTKAIATLNFYIESYKMDSVIEIKAIELKNKIENSWLFLF